MQVMLPRVYFQSCLLAFSLFSASLSSFPSRIKPTCFPEISLVSTTPTPTQGRAAQLFMVIPYFQPAHYLSPPICIFIMQTIHTHENSDKMKGRGVVQQFLPSQLCEIGEDQGLLLAAHVQPWGCSFNSSVLSNVIRLGQRGKIQKVVQRN